MARAVARMYTTWRAMRERCNNKAHASYHLYGGRGIVVCEEWEKFENFFVDMYPNYSQGLSIDRIDNDGNYEPTNCRWATAKEQGNNRGNNRFIKFNGESKTASEWADYLEMDSNTLRARLDVYGWSVEKTLTTKPAVRSKKMCNEGHPHSGKPRKDGYFYCNTCQIIKRKKAKEVSFG